MCVCLCAKADIVLSTGFRGWEMKLLLPKFRGTLDELRNLLHPFRLLIQNVILFYCFPKKEARRKAFLLFSSALLFSLPALSHEWLTLFHAERRLVAASG